MSYVGRATTNVSRVGVFISYARGDGEEFAERLRERLETEGVRLWQDRVALEGGRDWWLQITEALDRVEFMVLVMTPNALRSETVRKEWRYARQQGVCVYPVKGSEGLDFDSLPRWMRDVHFYDLGRLKKGGAAGPEWKKFVNDLNTRCQARRVPFMVEDMPEDFVERPGEFEQLLSLLLDQREEPVAITAALRGAGGYGKTTLARALCHDGRVQDAFDDGVLWVTLGETPGDLTGRVEDLIYTLSDERPGFTGVDAATTRLVELLADRDIILVIDDVWNGEHLRPFMQGGPRCARLVTTRNADTLPATARNVDVDAMRQREAVALLGAGLPRGEVEDLRLLAARLGEWPLLLKLVNGTLRERANISKQRLPDAVAYVNKALDRRGLTFFDARNPASRAQAVSMTLGVSLEQLNDGERARYGELAIFPEDVDVPLATLTRLWSLTGGFDEFDTEELCARLSRLSLLLRLDLAGHSIRLHDAIRKYLMWEAGDGLAAIHGRLLDAYQPEPSAEGVREGRWSDLPQDEPYLWQHLSYHLLGAGLGSELVETVKDLGYLAVLTFVRSPVAAEADLIEAEKVAPDDTLLPRLRLFFAQSSLPLSGHARLKDLCATIGARLQHDERLVHLLRDLERFLAPPYLTALHPLPDLPHPRLLRTLSGHTSWVTSCAVSPDHSFVASTSLDDTAKVWPLRGGAEPFTLYGHTEPVERCAVSPDSSSIVTAAKDKTLRVWAAPAWEERFVLAGHAAEVWDCAFSPDGRYIVSASEDKTLKIWRAADAELLFTLEGHTASIGRCIFSPDGSFVLSSSSDCTLKIWDAASGRERLTLAGHSKGVKSCALSRDGSFAVSASSDGTLKVWDTATGEERHTLYGHESRVTTCAISPDQTFIVSTSWDGTVRVWDVATGWEIHTLYGLTEYLWACAVSPDSSLIAADAGAGIVKLWDAQTGMELDTLSGHTHNVGACPFSPDGSFLVTSSSDETLKVWDLKRAGSHRRGPEQSFTVRHCAASDDGSRVLTASDAMMAVWDSESGELLETFYGDSSIKDCAISPDGSFVASRHLHNEVIVWDVAGGYRRLALQMDEMDMSELSLAMSSDGSQIAFDSDDFSLQLWEIKHPPDGFVPAQPISLPEKIAASKDGRLILTSGSEGKRVVLDAETGEELYVLRGRRRHILSGHADEVKDCVFSPDGSFIVTASADTTLIVWDAKTGERLHTLAGHEWEAKHCAVSPDSSLIASRSWTIMVWDARTGAALHTLKGRGTIEDFAFSPDGRFIASASSDRTIRLWDVRDGACLCTLRTDGEMKVCMWLADGRRLVAGGHGGAYFLKLIL